MPEKVYPATGTCYWCDVILPEERLFAPPPGLRFCSDACEKKYKNNCPRRYRELTKQLKDIGKKDSE